MLMTAVPFVWASPLSAQSPTRIPTLRVATSVTMAEPLGRDGPRYGIELRVERPVRGGHIGIWGAGAREDLKGPYCLDVAGTECYGGPAWLGSFGLSAYLFPAHLTPYVGAGIGRRRFRRTGLEENVRTVFFGVQVKGTTRFSIRAEGMLRTESSPQLVFGFGVDI